MFYLWLIKVVEVKYIRILNDIYHLILFVESCSVKKKKKKNLNYSDSTYDQEMELSRKRLP